MTSTQPFGTVSKASDGTYTLRYERHLAHPIGKVWQAITDPQQVEKWFGVLRQPMAEGGPFYLDFPHSPGSKAEGTVMTVRPETLVEYTWMSRNEPMNVRWELAEEGANATRLTLTHKKLKDGAHHYGGGWHAHLNLLEKILDGTYDTFTMDMQEPKDLEPHYEQAVEEVA